MGPEKAYYYTTALKKDDFSLIYFGDFTKKQVKSVVQLNQITISDSKSFKDIAPLLISECFKNVIDHADTPDIINRTNNKPKMFMIRTAGNTFCMASTNLVNNTKKEKLISKLKEIKSTSLAEIEKTYLDAISIDAEVEDGNGLGLIELAKITGSALEFELELINYFLSNFYLQLQTGSPAYSFSDTKKLYNSLFAENILMIVKGDFSQKTILPLLDLIENNFTAPHQKALKKKTGYLLIELLQNISRHGAVQNSIKEGILMISIENKIIKLTTGNYVAKEKVGNLNKIVSNLVSLDEKGLSELYRDKLLKKKKSKTDSGSAGVGLIDICKYSSSGLNYYFKPVDDTISFFSLSVTI